jgi:cysteine synthase
MMLAKRMLEKMVESFKIKNGKTIINAYSENTCVFVLASTLTNVRPSEHETG